ncbi:MAG: GNAT family N-acetyltransferase [Selenomonadaceae bacterium]|nr:GNAT family N-acetyltransferase [Selenomonadaceae bacterium]
MKEVLIEGRRLKLRRATLDDLNYIMTLQYAPENLKFIVPFDEDYHRKIFTCADKMDIIVEEIDSGQAVGYFMLRELDTPCAEFTHVIIDKKGVGYGREALKLLMKWTFEVKRFHRIWIDCKDYNYIALRLYESLGFVREGVLREIILNDGDWENLIVLGILDREYYLHRWSTANGMHWSVGSDEWLI